MKEKQKKPKGLVMMPAVTAPEAPPGLQEPAEAPPAPEGQADA